MPPPRSTLFPYTTLFRSQIVQKNIHDYPNNHTRFAVLANDPNDVRIQQPKVGDKTTLLITLPSDQDRKSTRLNSSHVAISYAVFCLKKKITIKHILWTK